MYDYEKAVKKDIEEWIHNNVDIKKFKNDQEMWECLLDDYVMLENACGGGETGYYFETETEAREALKGNDELKELALRDQNVTDEERKDARFCDGMIRWMMYYKVLDDVCEEVFK